GQTGRASEVAGTRVPVALCGQDRELRNVDRYTGLVVQPIVAGSLDDRGGAAQRLAQQTSDGEHHIVQRVPGQALLTLGPDRAEQHLARHALWPCQAQLRQESLRLASAADGNA